MAVNVNELEYYCRFDPNTGIRTGGYVKGINAIPEDAIKVSANDFQLYSSDPNWRYNWETNSPEYVKPIVKLSLETLRAKALTKVDATTKADIEGGFTMKLRASLVRFDSDVMSQVTYTNYATAALNDPSFTCEVHGCVSGDLGKTALKLTAPEIILLQRKCAEHIERAKAAGWKKRDWVNQENRTSEELLTYLGGE